MSAVDQALEAEWRALAAKIAIAIPYTQRDVMDVLEKGWKVGLSFDETVSLLCSLPPFAAEAVIDVVNSYARCMYRDPRGDDWMSHVYVKAQTKLQWAEEGRAYEHYASISI